MTPTTQSLRPDISTVEHPFGVKCERAAPSVSLIIPAYNVAAFISETLASVFAQTFTDFEVIVVNDGSPDTEELERELARFIARVNYVKQENRGASAARNAGLRTPRGEFVAFLDADDAGGKLAELQDVNPSFSNILAIPESKC